MPKNKPPKPIEKPSANHIFFSFAHILKGCGQVKNKNFFFTNQVPINQIREYRTTIDNALWDWSAKTVQQLEKDRICYSVKPDKNNETRNNIAKVFQTAKYPTEWIKQNIQDPDIYKFKITKQIRLFGIVERNVVYILLYDIWHLINKVQWKNFPIPHKLVCTWCLKSCDKKK